MNFRRHAMLVMVVPVLVPLILAAQPQEPRKITVVARKYDFEPRRIELKAGQPVAITFESEDTKHGFSCNQLQLDKITFSKDQPRTITFTPATPGTYEFKCSKFCGIGHRRMKGEIVVTP